MSPARQAGRTAGRRAGSTTARAGRRAPGTAAPEAAAAPPASSGAGTSTGAPAAEADSTPVAPAGGPADGGHRRRRRPSWPAFAFVAVLAVLAVIGLVISNAKLLHDRDVSGLRASALQAARSYATSVTTYSAASLDDDVARVKKISSPDFAKEYDRTIAPLRAQITSTGTASKGTVLAAGIEQISDSAASVLVVANQDITATGQPARTEADRLRVVLVRRDGSWYLQTVQRL